MKRLLIFLVGIVGTTLLASCGGDELDIRRDFPFDVEVMPVPKEVADGQTVEIRVVIKRTGDYEGTGYFIRYFQYDGQGTLQYHDDPPYLPNDLYALPETQFRLYYTSQSTISQSFDIWISDNFRNEQQLSFQFNGKD